jgi:FlaA1/EpsC-like NDP-sugar epimerase
MQGDLLGSDVLSRFAGKRILVTGALGSIGSAVVPRLRKAGAVVVATDLESYDYRLDVRDSSEVDHWVKTTRPDLVFHLAGAKHAPEGELNPFGVAQTNITGTRYVLEAAAAVGAQVVLASSCKACNPETAYGATKLIAERMVLNAGGSVARFYNVAETSGNVFETWRGLPVDDPLPVTPCTRFFITLERAVGLLLAAASLPSGRYCVNPGEARWMADVAHELYPGRAQLMIEPRRGDRLHEPRYGTNERASLLGSDLEQVWSPHDPVVEPALAVAA